MKRLMVVGKQKKYIMSHYVMEKVFKVNNRTIICDEVVYDNYCLAHEGSYVKKWTMEFCSEKKLKIELKKWYKKSTLFYGSVTSALLNRQNVVKSLITIKEVGGDGSSGYYFSITKDRKKKSSKNRRHIYYCDCYHCTGMVYDKYQKIVDRYERSINCI
jgi:hypothetical protein